jgi:hypothetical protein
VGYAQGAVQRAQPAQQQEFAVTLQAAQRGAPVPLKPRPPSARTFDALRAGDARAAFEAARAMAGDSRAARATLAASRYRFPADNDRPFAGPAVETALGVIQTMAGATDLDGALALYDAVKTCSSALLGLHVPPPLGTSITREAFRTRMGGGAPAPGQGSPVAQAPQAGGAGDPDPVVFPGQCVAKLSDYVRIMKGMQSGNAMGALAQAGLDMNGYTQVATQWGQAMQRDPSLVAKFHALMQQR